MLKKYWAYILLAFAITFFIFKMCAKANIVFTNKIIENNNGFGYEIYKSNAIYISQKFIPGANGNIAFSKKEDAQKVADLIIEKLKIKPSQFPTIELKELDSLGIKY